MMSFLPKPFFSQGASECFLRVNGFSCRFLAGHPVVTFLLRPDFFALLKLDFTGGNLRVKKQGLPNSVGRACHHTTHNERAAGNDEAASKPKRVKIHDASWRKIVTRCAAASEDEPTNSHGDKAENCGWMRKHKLPRVNQTHFIGDFSALETQARKAP